MQEIIERYQRHTKDVQGEKPSTEQNNMQNLNHDTESLMKKIELIETSKRFNLILLYKLFFFDMKQNDFYRIKHIFSSTFEAILTI